MLKEKKKSESTLRCNKVGKLPTQKVSLCLASVNNNNNNNHSILKPKRHSFRYNLNIKFKTTKSSPEKTIINNNNNNQDECSSQKVSTNIDQQQQQQQATTGSNMYRDIDTHKTPSDEFLKSKLIKKQTKMNKLNFTNPKYIINNNKVFKQRLLSPIASNNYSNSNSNTYNNNNMNIHKQTNSHNSLNELFIINNNNNNYKQLHTPNSQTMPGSIHTSRRQSKDKKLIIQHHLHSMRINNNNNNHNNITAPSMHQQQQHNTLLIGCSKRSFNKNLLLQPRKNRILTNITRNCDKKRKVPTTRSDNNTNTNMNLLTSNQSIKSNASSNSQDKIVSIRRNAKNNNLNLKSILLCSNTINTNSNSNNSAKAHHLTSENSPTKKKLSSFHSKRCCDNNNNNNNTSLIKKDKCNKTTYAKLNHNINIHNHIIHNGDGDNSSVNKHIIYSLKTSRIGVANMKIHTEGGLLLRNSHKGYVYNKSSGNNNNNSTQQHSKSTSHSKHKKAITRKINNKKMHKDSGNSSSNNTSKRNNNNNTSKSKTTKPQHVICTSNTNNGNNNHHHHHHQQQFITEHSFSFSNTNNNSISSIKSQLIKEGTYYSLESNRLSSYIKSYYTKHNAYPKTKLPFYKFGRLIGRGAFGKVNLGLHILSGRIVAIKSFNKSKLETPSKARDKIYHEVSLMRNLKHNLIIRIYETIETSQYILIIMEHISGGDLLSFVKKRTKLSEKTAKYIFRQLITALKHIHSHNIVHRDIKLDNILIDLNNNIKLCDFGVSKQIHKGMLLKDKCGTPAYIAPEILSSDNDNGYEGPPVDMWSSGVVLYAMLSGTVPFKPANLKELNKIMMKGEYSPIQDISKEATHLISGLLELDPKKRFTIDKVMNHPWLISDNGSKNEVMLFTKAEMVLLSKANVDYRYARKSEMMEHFTIKNLDTNNDKCNKNVSSKSFIFAPFNSTFTSVSDGDNEECGLEVEKEVIKFNNETQALNRIYELNYNGEIDHGVLIQHHSQDGDNNTQQQQQQQQQQRCNAGVSLSINGNDKNNSLISGECYNDELESPLSHEYDCNNTQSNTQRNYVTSLTTTTITQHIDENTLNACERLGYSKPYMQYVLNENELNYATTTYYLLCNTTTTTTTTTDTSI